MPAAVELIDVAFSYPGHAPTLTGVRLVVREGEFLAVAGPNGGGKSTLLRLMLGLERPSSGAALLYGEPAHRASVRPRVGYLPQRARVGIGAPVTVHELVTAGRAAVERPFGPLSAAGRQRVEAAVEEVGLSSVARRPVAQLSGGQQQRAFLAKLLAADPRLIALDEPTTGVDVDAQERLAELLCELHSRHGVTILYVSHEFGAIEGHVQRLVLVRGGIVFDGPIGQLPQVWHDPSHHHGREGSHACPSS
ncbi:MAG TPA: ATP-binding cassette domain-containing protein [Thermoanaerobaculia bacterium]|nr:ATP-binding cassette domain-containing protein [Thermoanaerobaculia bacterium]